MRPILASWNVRGWVDDAGVHDPGRFFEALEGFEADLVALQEVEGREWQGRARALGWEPIEGITRRGFGNALLVRSPVASLRRIDLSVAGREPRGAIDVIVETSESPLRVVTTHLGLRRRERRIQSARLARHVDQVDREVPLVVVGDFNDWTPWGAQLAPLARVVGRFSRLPTFPSRRPILALDRAAARGRDLALAISVLREPGLNRLSDHLPLHIRLG